MKQRVYSNHFVDAEFHEWFLKEHPRMQPHRYQYFKFLECWIDAKRSVHESLEMTKKSASDPRGDESFAADGDES